MAKYCKRARKMGVGWIKEGKTHKEIFQSISSSPRYFGWKLFLVSCPGPSYSQRSCVPLFFYLTITKALGDPCLETLHLPLHYLRKLAPKSELQISVLRKPSITAGEDNSVRLSILACSLVLDRWRPSTWSCADHDTWTRQRKGPHLLGQSQGQLLFHR